jgi:thymidylate synthase
LAYQPALEVAMINRINGGTQIIDNDIYAVWLQLLKTLLEHGQNTSPRSQKTKELLGLQLRINYGRKNVMIDTQRKLNCRFLVAQWLATMIGAEDKLLERWNKQLANYEDDGHGGKYPSYGPRLLPQWPYVLNQLMDDLDTRQAVASIWEAQRLETERYVPCTLSLQYLLRPAYVNNIWEQHQKERPLTLVTVATMRSSDAWLGIPYDVYNFTQLANVLAATLSLALRRSIDVGEFILTLGSSHLYEQHWETARSIVNAPTGGCVESPRIKGGQQPLMLLTQYFQEQLTDDQKVALHGMAWPWNRYVDCLEAPNNVGALDVLKALAKEGEKE